MSGWGQSTYGGKLDQVLRQTELPVVENKHCKQMYGTMYNIPINKYHLCAGPLHEGGVGTCIVSETSVHSAKREMSKFREKSTQREPHLS